MVLVSGITRSAVRRIPLWLAACPYERPSRGSQACTLKARLSVYVYPTAYISHYAQYYYRVLCIVTTLPKLTSLVTNILGYLFLTRLEIKDDLENIRLIVFTHERKVSRVWVMDRETDRQIKGECRRFS